jgi:hypothetical protein
MWASGNGHESIVRALLAAGADINSECEVYLLLMQTAVLVVYMYGQLYSTCYNGYIQRYIFVYMYI